MPAPCGSAEPALPRSPTPVAERPSQASQLPSPPVTTSHIFPALDFNSTVRDFDAFCIFRSGKTAKITHGGIEWGTGWDGRCFGRRTSARGGGGKPPRRGGRGIADCWTLRVGGQSRHPTTNFTLSTSSTFQPFNPMKRLNLLLPLLALAAARRRGAPDRGLARKSTALSNTLSKCCKV